MIEWTKEKNKIRLKGEKSYISYGSMPEPPLQSDNKG